jgi:hypothetical protein
MLWGRLWAQLLVSALFLAFQIIVLQLILRHNQRASAPSMEPPPLSPALPEQQFLPAADVLAWEFEYARVTASEAMEQRHTMINFYLLASGIVVSGVLAVLAGDADLPPVVGTVLLWLLCLIGWVYFLAVIRLRQAWQDSARAMNQIKDFYARHVREVEPSVLRSAFRWRTETLPEPQRPWTVYHYSALLIALVDSVAYVAGGILLSLGAVPLTLLVTIGYMTLLGLAFLAYHMWLYAAFLKQEPAHLGTAETGLS